MAHLGSRGRRPRRRFSGVFRYHAVEGNHCQSAFASSGHGASLAIGRQGPKACVNHINPASVPASGSRIACHCPPLEVGMPRSLSAAARPCSDVTGHSPQAPALRSMRSTAICGARPSKRPGVGWGRGGKFSGPQNIDVVILFRGAMENSVASGDDSVLQYLSALWLVRGRKLNLQLCIPSGEFSAPMHTGHTHRAKF
jgi:hypothetical protein